MCTAGSSVARMFAARRPGLLDESLGASFDGRFDPDEERRRPLRVEVPQQHPRTARRGFVSEVDRGRRLADATLDAVRGEHLHVVDRFEHGVEGAFAWPSCRSRRTVRRTRRGRLTRVWSSRSVS